MQVKLVFVVLVGICLIFSNLLHSTYAEQITINKTKITDKTKNVDKAKVADKKATDKTKTKDNTKNAVKTKITESQKTNYDAELAKCDKLQTAADKRTCKKEIELTRKIQSDKAKATPYVIGSVTFYYVSNHMEKTSQGNTILTIYFVVENTGSSQDVAMSCPRQNSCNYVLSDGQKEIQYATNTLVYGLLTLQPHTPKLLEWSFFEGLKYDPAKDYSFKIKEPWGSGSISLGID